MVYQNLKSYFFGSYEILKDMENALQVYLLDFLVQNWCFFGIAFLESGYRNVSMCSFIIR